MEGGTVRLGDNSVGRSVPEKEYPFAHDGKLHLTLMSSFGSQVIPSGGVFLCPGLALGNIQCIILNHTGK